MLSSKLDRSSPVICNWDAAGNWTDFPKTFQLGSVCDIISRDESMYRKSMLGADWVDSLCSAKISLRRALMLLPPVPPRPITRWFML